MTERQSAPSEESSAATVVTSHLQAVLVTYRRPDALANMLDVLASQTRKPDQLIVVDNAPSDIGRNIVELFGHGNVIPVRYIPSPENLGPAGGLASGLEELMHQDVADEDWVVLLDDDDPPTRSDIFEQLLAFAVETSRERPQVGGVGLGVGTLDRRSGRVMRLPDELLHGPVAVDWIDGGGFPLYRLHVIRQVGLPDPALFFGFDDLEYGLRIRREGFELYTDGDVLRRAREENGRIGFVAHPRKRVSETTWRSYYSLRNSIHILMRYGFRTAAFRRALIGVGKPTLNLPMSPRLSVKALRVNVRAIRDGFTGRMGRTVEPHSDL